MDRSAIIAKEFYKYMFRELGNNKVDFRDSAEALQRERYLCEEKRCTLETLGYVHLYWGVVLSSHMLTTNFL